MKIQILTVSGKIHEKTFKKSESEQILQNYPITLIKFLLEKGCIMCDDGYLIFTKNIESFKEIE